MRRVRQGPEAVEEAQRAGNKGLKRAMAEGPRGGVALRDILSRKSPEFNSKVGLISVGAWRMGVPTAENEGSKANSKDLKHIGLRSLQ